MISECAVTYYLFDGKCFTTCPERTFVVPERVSFGNVRSKGLSLRKRAWNIDEFDNLEDITRPESLVKNRAIMMPSAQKLCGSCHESCLKCNGPLEKDCVACDSNYNQIIIGSSVSCAIRLNNATTSLLESLGNELKSFSRLKIILISSLIGVAVLLIVSVCIYLLLRKYESSKAAASERGEFKYSYNQLVENENEEALLTKLTNIPIHSDDDDSDG